MASLFISYSRKDIDIARKLTEAFNGQEMDYWIDWEDIPPTVEWWQEIKKGIEEADIFLFLLSPDSAKSKVCKQEIEHAAQNGKRLIPVVVRDINAEESPLEFSNLNWVFFRKKDIFDDSLENLITAIKTDYEWVQIHRRLQMRALEWEHGNKDNSFLLRGKDLQDAEARLVANSGKNPNPTDLQTEYVLQSRQASNRQRRITTGIAIAGVIVLAALAVFGFIQANLATDNAIEAQSQAATAHAASTLAVANEATAVANEKLAEERAKIARARELAAQSVTLQERNFQNSLLLGIEAFQLVDNAQTLGAILDNIRTNPQLLKIITGHSGAVNSVAFSPNGEILASGSRDNTIIFWNIETGQPIGQPLRGHTDFVTSIAFSPDGRTLVSGSGDKSIILWDVESGQVTGKPLTGHSNAITRVVYSPNGKSIVSGDLDGNIILWDAMTRQPMGQPLKLDETGWVWSLAVSPDSKTIASTGFAIENLSSSPVIPPYITLWDITTRHFIRQPLIELQQAENSGYGFNQYGFAWNVAFSPDGRTIASGTSDGVIILWDTVTKRSIGQPLKEHTSTVNIAFSPDGNTFASASDDGTIILWDVTTGQPIGNPLRGHSGEINSITFSPDRKILASGGEDNSIILWDVSAAFNTNVTTDYPIGEEVEGVLGSQLSMVFSPDGKTLASGNIFAISFWDMTTHPPERHSNSGDLGLGQVHSLAFSPDGKTLVSADDNKIILWDATSREPIIEEPFKEHSDTVNSVAYSPDGKTVASASDDNTIILWDVNTQQSIGEPLRGHSGPVNSVAFSPNNRILASGSDDNSIILWDVSTPAYPKMLTKYSLEASSTGHSDPVKSLTFSSDGKLLASASDDNSIILWDITSNKPIGQPLTGHLSLVSSVAFSPDDRILASASSDKTVILWDVATGQPLGQPLRGAREILYGVAFSPDGKTLVSGGATTTLIFWDLDPHSWIKKACIRAGRNFTRVEWDRYFPNEEYRITCPQWPAGE